MRNPTFKHTGTAKSTPRESFEPLRDSVAGQAIEAQKITFCPSQSRSQSKSSHAMHELPSMPISAPLSSSSSSSIASISRLPAADCSVEESDL